MFFQSKIRAEAIEANRQFGQIVYGKSGRIGDLLTFLSPKLHVAVYRPVILLILAPIEKTFEHLSRAAPNFVAKFGRKGTSEVNQR